MRNHPDHHFLPNLFGGAWQRSFANQRHQLHFLSLSHHWDCDLAYGHLRLLLRHGFLDWFGHPAYRSPDGRAQHEKVHSGVGESRRVVRTERDLKIASCLLGITGQTDAVEFYSDGKIIPIEYKHGEQKEDTCDEVQLCAQAICLEEMLICSILEGDLFYGEPHRRTTVHFTESLREEVKKLFNEMNELYKRGNTPKVKLQKRCRSCSLYDICVPQIRTRSSAGDYIRAHLEDLT